jgi:TonB family protein
LFSQHKLIPYKKGDWYGVKDENGKKVVKPNYFLIFNFSEGLAVAENKDGLWGFIDENGRETVPFQYYYEESFSNGLALVKDISGKSGYINKSGKVVIPFKYTATYSFKEGYARVVNEDGDYGLIDTTGNLFLNKYFRYMDDVNSGIIRVQMLNNKPELTGIIGAYHVTGYYKTNGELIGNQWFDAGDDFRNDTAKVVKNGKRFFLKSNGELIENVNTNIENDFDNTIHFDAIAVFPGGEGAMNQWVAMNIRYPDEAKGNGWQDKVFAQFVVEKDGRISNIKIIKGKYIYLNDEVIRLIQKMPKWDPAMIKGKPVRSIFKLPVTFKLGEATHLNKSRLFQIQTYSVSSSFGH